MMTSDVPYVEYVWTFMPNWRCVAFYINHHTSILWQLVKILCYISFETLSLRWCYCPPPVYTKLRPYKPCTNFFLPIFVYFADFLPEKKKSLTASSSAKKLASQNNNTLTQYMTRRSCNSGSTSKSLSQWGIYICVISQSN